MKALYLAPLLPAPSGSGGKRAIYNHLEDMLAEGAEADAFFVDVEDTGVHNLQHFARFSPRVFSRAMPKFGAGLKGKLAAITGVLVNALPRSVAVVASKDGRALIANKLAANDYDVIIIDHLNAYGMIRGLKLSIPVVYVAHNVESEVLRQAAARLPAWSLRRLIARLDSARMLRIEGELLALADRVLLIGAADGALPAMRRVADKTVLWPELPQLKTPQWHHPGGKRLLFVGSARYFPNKDAIKWLVEALLPELLAADAEVTLEIVGTSWDEMAQGQAPKGATFHGFVSDEVLDLLHYKSAMFICPVVLGAGIKIKMLEAASYGLPSAATPESLAGIDFLTSLALRFERNDPSGAAGVIVALLSDPDRLDAIGNACMLALNDTIAARISLFDHARTLLAGKPATRVDPPVRQST